MKQYKGLVLFLILVGTCQIQAAAYAGAIAKMAAVLGLTTSASLWVEGIAFKLEERKIIQDPNAETALKWLDWSSSSQVRFTSAGPSCQYASGGKDSDLRCEYAEDVEYVLESDKAYSMAKGRDPQSKLIDYKRMLESPIRDCKVCRIHSGLVSWDECVAVEGIQTWSDLETFLEHVRWIRAKEASEVFEYPALRRLKSRVMKSTS